MARIPPRTDANEKRLEIESGSYAPSVDRRAGASRAVSYTFRRNWGFGPKFNTSPTSMFVALKQLMSCASCAGAMASAAFNSTTTQSSTKKSAMYSPTQTPS